MNLKELIVKTRTYRRFDESYQIDNKALESFIDLARLSPSGANKQPSEISVLQHQRNVQEDFSISWPGPDTLPTGQDLKKEKDPQVI